MNTSSQALKDLHAELEQLRTYLHQSVKGELSLLADPNIVPISQELDLLIVQVQKEHVKNK